MSNHSDLPNMQTALLIYEMLALEPESNPKYPDEIWAGLLYGVFESNSLCGLDYESALCLKIDGDLAKAKDKPIEEGLFSYLSGAAQAAVVAGYDLPNPKKTKIKPPRSKGHRPRTRNSVDMKRRFRKAGKEALDFIEKKAKKLDSKKSMYGDRWFSHDEYKSTVEQNAHSLNELDTRDQCDGIRKSKRLPTADEQFAKMR